MNKVILLPGKESSLLRFHPWIFSGAINTIEGETQEGDLVEVVDSKGNFLGVGYTQIGSIAVRILSFEPTLIDHLFWVKRMNSAYDVRLKLGLISNDNNTYRLVHGEGDNLPGLIIDMYGKTAVMQAHTVAIHVYRKEITAALIEVLGEDITVYYKSESTLPFMADLNAENEYLYGNNDTAIATENGLLFNIDWLKGQKTGFFVDQRENRSLLEKFSANKKILNMFCYTGGFSVYALRGGASLVHSVDSSAKAIELTNRNVELNFPKENRHESFATDAFKFLETMEENYDIIILDPPAFAKHRKVLKNALQGYQKMNAKAFRKIKPGGIIFTFSCSQVVSKDQLRLSVFSAAAQSGRKVRIIQQLTQPADHPISIYHPEGEYLKGFILYVE